MTRAIKPPGIIRTLSPLVLGAVLFASPADAATRTQRSSDALATILVTPCDSAGWSARAQGSASLAIDGSFPHSTGSLHLEASGAGSSADFVRANLRGEKLYNLTQLAIELYRSSSSTAPASVAPVVRLLIENGNATDRYSELIWEPKRNGVTSFPTDAWTQFDFIHGFVWQHALDPDRVIDVYDRTIDDWVDDGPVTDADGDVSSPIDGQTRVIGFEIGVRLDVPGTFIGAADLFRFTALGGRDSLFDIETVNPNDALSLRLIPSPVCGATTLEARATRVEVSGVVEFFDGDTPLGTAPIEFGGTSTFTRNLMPGTYVFGARYDSGTCGLVSDPLAVSLTAVPMNLSLDAAFTASGSVTLSAEITPKPGGAGTFTFKDGNLTIGTPRHVGAGVAKVALAFHPSLGVHTITATYEGDHCLLDSQEPLIVTIGVGPTVWVSNATVTEGHALSTPISFQIDLSSAQTETVSVDYETLDGSATVADDDYVPTTGTAFIPPGETQATVEVEVGGDQQEESDEYFSLSLTHASVGIADSVGRGFILDDDNAFLTINDVSAIEGDADSTLLFFVVRASNALEQTMQVSYETRDGTATVTDHDYQPVNGVLTFTPGELTQGILIWAQGNTVFESDETFTVVLSSPVNAQLGDSVGIGTIRNDDLELIPMISIDDATLQEPAVGTAMMAFHVRLSMPVGASSQVTYTTIDGGSARSGLDYNATSGILTIEANASDGWVYVPIHADDLCELDETFSMHLSRSSIFLADADATGTILDVDCATPTLVTAFAAETIDDRIQVHWRLSRGASATLERGPAPGGPWNRVDAEIRVNGDETVALDRMVDPGATWWYRLLAHSESGTAIVHGPISGTAAQRVTVFGLGAVTPNPTFGATRIEYLVARPSEVELAIVDVQGRQVARLAAGVQPAGKHAVTWNGESEHGTAPAGLYFVRYHAAGRTWTHRLAIVR